MTAPAHDDLSTAQQRFSALRKADGRVNPEELDSLWAALPTVRAEELLGRWRGFEFDTGHRTNGQLQALRWYGKEFISQWDVKPLLCRGEDGELFSHVKAGKGEASLQEVSFRGEVTATMVYDGQPVFDHFKRVDDGTVMGIMNGKHVLEDGCYYYFGLERD